MHILRKNGKGLKPGPSKRKPKSVFDVELVTGEPIDLKSLKCNGWRSRFARGKKSRSN